MAKRSLAIDICEMICPDRWEYKYDGVKFTAIEYFDDNISREDLEGIQDRWIRSGGNAALDGNKLTVDKVIPQHYAVSNLAIEGALQASVLDLITIETQCQVIADICANIPAVESEAIGGKG